jgi:hypothetical protein
MFCHVRRHKLALGVATAMLAIPTVAHADDDDRAEAAIAAATGKIQAATASSEYSANIVTRAQSTLDKAKAQLRDGDEDRALHGAEEASAYAELALATNELRTLQEQAGIDPTTPPTE